ncbi:translation initiation factor IF-2-like [Lutra lutra]|uniref:translation initiation factor IF-2-like n=1 Tax=Lutra lutra TaxID=9657 RepID=UPI001FD1EF2B|nr:translation initiation factor IF-2-like [Lutra lutra]
MRYGTHSGASDLAPPPTERHAGVSATPGAQVAPLRGIRRGTGQAGKRTCRRAPTRAQLRPTALPGVGGRAPLPAVLAAWASRSGHRRPAGRTRGQGSEARAHAGGGRRGACRGLGFTGPHGRAGGELRPPVALGAESHPRPRPKPRVIFNQRRRPGYHQGRAGRERGARDADLPRGARQPGGSGAHVQAREAAGAQAHAERAGKAGSARPPLP